MSKIYVYRFGLFDGKRLIEHYEIGGRNLKQAKERMVHYMYLTGLSYLVPRVLEKKLYEEVSNGQ